MRTGGLKWGQCENWGVQSIRRPDIQFGSVIRLFFAGSVRFSLIYLHYFICIKKNDNMIYI